MGIFGNERFARCLVRGINNGVATVLFIDDDQAETIRETPLSELRYISPVITRGPGIANVQV